MEGVLVGAVANLRVQCRLVIRRCILLLIFRLGDLNHQDLRILVPGPEPVDAIA